MIGLRRLREKRLAGNFPTRIEKTRAGAPQQLRGCATRMLLQKLVGSGSEFGPRTRGRRSGPRARLRHTTISTALLFSSRRSRKDVKFPGHGRHPLRFRNYKNRLLSNSCIFSRVVAHRPAVSQPGKDAATKTGVEYDGRRLFFCDRWFRTQMELLPRLRRDECSGVFRPYEACR